MEEHVDHIEIAREEISALLLAGGQGRRMGHVDKGFMELAGKALAEHVIARLSPQCSELLINANQNLAAWQQLGWQVIPDATGHGVVEQAIRMAGRPNIGPLAGFFAGLVNINTKWLVTAPCDAPFLPLDLTTRLGKEAIRQGVQLAVARSGKQLQPAFCLLHRQCQDSLADFLLNGGRKVRDWLGKLTHVEVDFVEDSAFINVNTPAELNKARVLARHYGAKSPK